MDNNPGYYDDLVNFPNGIPSPYENQIEMDLHRTFPNDSYFKQPSTIKSLRNVLLAYSRRNVTIGYCQGFNFIVGRLLKTTKNELYSFWIFVQMIENMLPLCYYSDLAGVIIDTKILQLLIKAHYSDLYNHIEKLNYSLLLNNILYKWFVSLFIQSTNEEISYLIWDSFFLGGSIVLFNAALAMLKMMKSDIMNSHTMEDLHNVFDEGITNYINIDLIKWHCVLKMFQFSNGFINSQRKLLEASTFESISNGKMKRFDMIKASKRQATYTMGIATCQRLWPICIYDLTYKNITQVQFIVLRVGECLLIDDDYFGKSRAHSFQNEESRYSDMQNRVSEVEYFSTKCITEEDKISKQNEEKQTTIKKKDIQPLKFSIRKRSNNNSRLTSKSTQSESIPKEDNEERLSLEKNPKERGTKYAVKSDSIGSIGRNYKAYLGLLIERRVHYCDEPEHDFEEFTKYPMLSALKNEASKIVDFLKQGEAEVLMETFNKLNTDKQPSNEIMNAFNNNMYNSYDDL